MPPRCPPGVVAPPRAKHPSSPFPVRFHVDRPAIWRSQDTWKRRGLGRGVVPNISRRGGIPVAILSMHRVQPQ